MTKREALTWENLAKIYNDSTGGHARTRPMELVFAWAENQPDKFIVSEDGYLYLKPDEKRKEK